MNPVETGKLIAKLRRDAGYTQAALAKALNITDKAVSKWERGNGMPDTALLPQLAKLLDCDTDILISGLSDYNDHTWSGLLILNDDGISVSSMICDKPLICYLLSYFLLVGITTVDIKASPKECDYIRSLHLERYGFHISFSPRIRGNTMVVFEKALIFGANLTRYFQHYMTAEDLSVIPEIDGRPLPIGFSHYTVDVSVVKRKAQRKKMGRGMLYLPLETEEAIRDASEFVRIYQKYHNVKIADLSEIARNRRILK